MGILYNRYYTNPAPQEYTVTITIDSYINHTGGALIQTDLSGPMTAVTLSPQDTYRINQPSGSSGITVTASGNNYVISGTPTADVTIDCTTTRNPDLLTATQKAVANWKTTASASEIYRYCHTGMSSSSTRINWIVDPVQLTSAFKPNEAYYIELPASQVPVGSYIFEIRYRIVDLGELDDGCRVGISSSRYNEGVNNNFICKIDILDTQTTYTTVSVSYTRSANENAYLAITNQYWKSNTSRQGRIYLDQIYLREV